MMPVAKSDESASWGRTFFCFMRSNAAVSRSSQTVKCWASRTERNNLLDQRRLIRKVLVELRLTRSAGYHDLVKAGREHAFRKHQLCGSLDNAGARGGAAAG